MPAFIFDVAKTCSGYPAIFDSDALQVAAMPFAEVTAAGDSVGFVLRGDATTTSFDGKRSGDAIVGTLTEGSIKAHSRSHAPSRRRPSPHATSPSRTAP